MYYILLKEIGIDCGLKFNFIVFRAYDYEMFVLIAMNTLWYALILQN